MILLYCIENLQILNCKSLLQSKVVTDQHTFWHKLDVCVYIAIWVTISGLNSWWLFHCISHRWVQAESVSAGFSQMPAQEVRLCALSVLPHHLSQRVLGCLLGGRETATVAIDSILCTGWWMGNRGLIMELRQSNSINSDHRKTQCYQQWKASFFFVTYHKITMTPGSVTDHRSERGCSPHTHRIGPFTITEPTSNQCSFALPPLMGPWEEVLASPV